MDDQQTFFQEALVDLLLHVAAADGSVERAELEVVANVMKTLGGASTTVHELDHAAREATPLGPQRFCDLRQNLQADQRRILLEGALRVALEDGQLPPAETERLIHVCEELGLELSELTAMMETALEDNSAGARPGDRGAAP